MNIEQVWNKILECEGERFYTKTGLPFDYERTSHDKVKIYRNGEPVGIVSKEDIDFIIENPNLPRHEYRDVMRTSSYALSLYYSIIEM